MKIGIGLPNVVRDVNPTLIPRWASEAEQSGFSTLVTHGRFSYPGLMDTATMAAAAGATTTVGLLSSILIGPAWPAKLLAKEIASIDGISGGRVTLGIGAGQREDDFPEEGYPLQGRGKRFDADLETYRAVWSGSTFAGGRNPVVPRGTRQVPLMFGGVSSVALRRMVRWGEGFIGPSVPPSAVAQAFDAARAAWQEGGRAGSPYLVALAYFTLGDTELGRSNVRDYYSSSVAPDRLEIVMSGIADTADKVREMVKAYQDLGVDELIFSPGADDIADVARLVDIVF